MEGEQSQECASGTPDDIQDVVVGDVLSRDEPRCSPGILKQCRLIQPLAHARQRVVTEPRPEAPPMPMSLAVRFPQSRNA